MIPLDSLRGSRPPLSNRIVLLGASNLTLSLKLAIRLLQERCGGPSEVLIAAGHGRSFGKYSQVLIRGLPGIVDCGLWRYLESAPDLPTYAFVTDIGNDVPYGHMPEELLRWVELCVVRLQRRSARIVMTNLPLQLVEGLTRRRFNVLRAVFFPFSKVSREQMVDRAAVVHRGLKDMAMRFRFQLCEQDADWFGPDIIHVLYWKRREAYRKLFCRFSSSHAPPTPLAGGVRATIRKKRPRFACKTVLGREIRHQQPSGQLLDGTLISMY